MKSVSLVLFAVIMLGISCLNEASASDLANGISLRNRHYAVCTDGATPRESLYVAGRYVISTSQVRYIGSCSPNKHKMHRARVAAYNYQRYMN